MKVKEWIDRMVANNMICREGVERLSYAHTKEDTFRILCDSFALDWLPELMLKGVALPLAEFQQEYKAFLNGRRVMEYPSGYTSKMYVRTQGETVVADTTLVSLIECRADVMIPENRYPRIVLSPRCDVCITMGNGARLSLDVYPNAKYSISGDMSRVRVTKYPKG